MQLGHVLNDQYINDDDVSDLKSESNYNNKIHLSNTNDDKDYVNEKSYSQERKNKSETSFEIKPNGEEIKVNYYNFSELVNNKNNIIIQQRSPKNKIRRESLGIRHKEQDYLIVQ